MSAFDPDQPIERPLPTLPPLVASGVWDLAQLRRFELAAAEGLRPSSSFAAAVKADALLCSERAIEVLLASGCDELHVDFDSLGGSERRADQLTQLVERLHAGGISVHGSFTLGQDHDDPGCFERLVEWIEARRLVTVELRLWTPAPGSSMVRRLAGADRVRHRDLQRWDGAHVVVAPAQMSAQTLYRGWIWARRRLSSLRSIWRRRPRDRRALAPYLVSAVWTALAPMRARARVRGRLLPALGIGLAITPVGQ